MDELVEEARRHIARDHERDDQLAKVREHVKELLASDNPNRREVAAELIEIVGIPE